MFKDGFSIADVVNARQHMDAQNKLDADGEISPWDIGLPAGVWSPGFAKDNQPLQDVITTDMKELEDAIKGLLEKIDAVKKPKKPKNPREESTSASEDSLLDLGLGGPASKKVFPEGGINIQKLLTKRVVK